MLIYSASNGCKCVSTNSLFSVLCWLLLLELLKHQARPGWVDLGGWLHTEMVYHPKPVTRTSTNRAHPSTNWAWRRVTSLIKTNALSLSQTANLFGVNYFYWSCFIFICLCCCIILHFRPLRCFYRSIDKCRSDKTWQAEWAYRVFRLGKPQHSGSDLL